MLRTLAILLATAYASGVHSATSCTLYNNDAETYGDDLTVVYPTGKHEVENYLRFSPYAIIAGLKLAGYEGRSGLPRFLTSAAVSNVIMAGAVTAAKHTFKAQRPDHSDNKSFPSKLRCSGFYGSDNPP